MTLEDALILVRRRHDEISKEIGALTGEAKELKIAELVLQRLAANELAATRKRG